MSTCPETRTIGDPPLTVTLTCRRASKHTGKHQTPEGDAEWWGPTDRQSTSTGHVSGPAHGSQA